MSENQFFIPGAPPLPTSPQPPGGPTRSHNEQGGQTPPVLDPSKPGSTPGAPVPPPSGLIKPGTLDRKAAAAAPSVWHVHPITGLLVFGLFLAMLVRALVSSHEHALAQAFAGFAAIVVAAVAVSLVPFFLARRSNAVLNVSTGLLVLGGITHAGWSAWNDADSIRDRQALASVERSVDQLKSKFRSQVDDERGVEVNIEEVSRTAKAMSRAGETVDGDAGVLLRVTSELLARIADDAQVSNAAMDALTDLGGLDPGSMTSMDDVQNRLTLVGAMLSENAKQRQEKKDLPRQFRTRLVKEGFSGKKLARAESEFANGFKMPLQLRLIDVKDQFAAAAQAYLLLLHDQWGRWDFNNETGQVTFKDPAMIGPFNQYSQVLQNAIAEESVVQRQILGMDAVAESDDSDDDQDDLAEAAPR